MDRDTLLEMLKALPPEERARALDVVRALHAIKAKRRDEVWRYPQPKNCGLVWPPSPPADSSTYTPRPPYRHLRLIRGGRT